jgi:hypothetical protein
MTKVDFKRELKEFYRPSAKAFSIVDVPEMTFLMIDGHGNPNNSPRYQAAVQALYGIAYAVKFLLKQDDGSPDYVVPPLEGLWWTADMATFSLDNKDAWDWTMMVMQPPWVTTEVVETGRRRAAKKSASSALSEIRLAPYHEGLSIQILYTGPYDDEAQTIAKMHAHAIERRYRLAGKHHEIYLSDPRRTAPAKLKTVLRQPIAR